MADNILDDELEKIVKRFFPLYDTIDEANKEIVRKSYKDFLEDALKGSFRIAKRHG